MNSKSFKKFTEVQPKDGQTVVCKCQNSEDTFRAKYHNPIPEDYPLGYFTINGEIIVFGQPGRASGMLTPV